MRSQEGALATASFSSQMRSTAFRLLSTFRLGRFTQFSSAHRRPSKPYSALAWPCWACRLAIFFSSSAEAVTTYSIGLFGSRFSSGTNAMRKNCGNFRLSVAHSTNICSASIKRFSVMPYKSARIEDSGPFLPSFYVHQPGSENFPLGSKRKFLIFKLPE
jgi:hypothetical protein